MDNYDYLFKCIIVGDGGAGKTAIVVRFSQGFFKEKYKLTIGVEFAVKNIELAGNVVKLQIWDTGGQDRFQYVRPLYYKGAMGCIVLFDLTNRESFDHIPRWLDEVQKEAGEIPMLLVGNKTDLKDQRMVSFEDAKELANKLKMEYIESSAKTGDGVKDLFAALAYLMMGEKIPEEYLIIAEEDIVSQSVSSQAQINQPSLAFGSTINLPQYGINKPKPRGLPKDVFQNRVTESKIIQPMPIKEPSRPKPLSLENNPTNKKYNSPPPPPPPSEFFQKKKESRPPSPSEFFQKKSERRPPLPPKSSYQTKTSDNFYAVLKQSVDKKAQENTRSFQQKPLKKQNYADYSSSFAQKVIPSNNRAKESIERVQERPKTRTCPNCGSQINLNFKFCNKCGKRLL